MPSQIHPKLLIRGLCPQLPDGRTGQQGHMGSCSSAHCGDPGPSTTVFLKPQTLDTGLAMNYPGPELATTQGLLPSLPQGLTTLP